MSVQRLVKELQKQANTDIAKHSQRFFKTDVGDYGEGDIFMGIRVPILRSIAKQHTHLSVTEVETALHSKHHEQRLCALLIWVYQYPKASLETQDAIYRCYLDNTKYINNWDLVDASAHKIIGPHLQDKDRSILHQLSQSNDLWERRIAMISCYYFIKQDDFDDALIIAKHLIKDEHDLIHKAVGWMLRELGKRNHEQEIKFLNQFYQQMPRTMLRYAIEKFPESLRLDYLHGRI